MRRISASPRSTALGRPASSGALSIFAHLPACGDYYAYGPHLQKLGETPGLSTSFAALRSENEGYAGKLPYGW